MHSRIAAVLVGGVALFLAGAPMGVANAAGHQLSGEVSQLDATAKTVTVKETRASGKEMTFTMAPSVKIMQGSRPKNLGDLEIGTRVTVTYADKGSTHMAKRIEVHPSKTAKDPAKPMTEPASGD